MAQKKKTTRKKVDVQLETEPFQQMKKPFFQRPISILALVIIFFILGSFLYRNKQLIIVGMVNNKPITSFELYKKMASQSGKQILDQIIVERLILEEANKKNIVIGEADIDGEVSKIEQNLGNNTTLADALSQQGMTLADLRSQVRMRLIAVKLVEEKISITDEEVNKYMKDNKDFLPKETDESKQKEEVKKLLTDQKTNSEIQNFIQQLKSSAKISTFL